MITRRGFIRMGFLAGAALASGLPLSSCHSTPTRDPSGLIACAPDMSQGYMGRWFDKNVQGVACKATVTPGAYLELEIEGARRIDACFEPMAGAEGLYWASQVDRLAPRRKPISEPTITLPDRGRHLVRIIADGTDEELDRWNAEKGFALSRITTAGGTISCHPSTRKVIAFYGDSISEGDCVLGPTSTPAHNSATGAFAWQVTEQLGAACYLCAYGSTGLLARGTFADAVTATGWLSKTRHAPRFHADLVIVEHGTNDVNAQSGPFALRYRQLLEQLAILHPSAPIRCLVPLTQAHRDQIARAVEQENRSMPPADDIVGKTRFGLIDTAGLDLSYSDQRCIHPDVAGATKLASHVAVALEGEFGKGLCWL